MTNTKDIIFIKQNIIGRCADLFLLLISFFACIFMLFPVIDALIQKEFVIAIVFILFFLLFLFFAYRAIIDMNRKVGFSPNAIILKCRNRTRMWGYEEIDWLACEYGEVELPYNSFGRILGRLFFKPIMEGVIFCCHGKIFNLTLFSGSEFRKLAKIHFEPNKIITHIQAKKLLSEKSRFAKLNYKMSYNPYCILLVILLAIGAYLFVLIGK